MKILCKWCEKLFDEKDIVFLPSDAFQGNRYVCCDCYKKTYEKEQKQ